MADVIRIELAGRDDAADLVRALAARGLPARLTRVPVPSVEVVSPREDTAAVLGDLVPVLERWCEGDEDAGVRLVVEAPAEVRRPLAAA